MARPNSSSEPGAGEREQPESRDIIGAGTLAILLEASILGHFEFEEALNRLLKLRFRGPKPFKR